MELKLQRNLVLQELSILQGVVEHRTTIPILSSILAEAAENRLRMVATDLDMTIVTECPAVVHGGGRVTLESKVFQNLVRNLAGGGVLLRQDGDVGGDRLRPIPLADVGGRSVGVSDRSRGAAGR